MARPVRSLIRERDETRKTDHDARAFKLERAEPFDFDGFALIDLRPPSSPFELKLTVNKDQAKDDNLWNGYGHLAVVGDDVDTWAEDEQAPRHYSCGPWSRWRGISTRMTSSVPPTPSSHQVP